MERLAWNGCASVCLRGWNKFFIFLQRMRQIIRMLLIVLTGIVLYNEKNEKINDCLERQEEA